MESDSLQDYYEDAVDALTNYALEMSRQHGAAQKPSMIKVRWSVEFEGLQIWGNESVTFGAEPQD